MGCRAARLSRLALRLRFEAGVFIRPRRDRRRAGATARRFSTGRSDCVTRPRHVFAESVYKFHRYTRLISAFWGSSGLQTSGRPGKSPARANRGAPFLASVHAETHLPVLDFGRFAADGEDRAAFPSDQRKAERECAADLSDGLRSDPGRDASQSAARMAARTAQQLERERISP